MVTVKSATYGDEKTTTDVTGVVSGKLTNGKADFTVDDSIVPMLVVSDKVELNDDEKEKIRAQAIKECRNANDTTCINATVNRLSQTKLEEKIENNRRIGNVTGPRLTVTIVDNRGREKTIIVPKGQSFTYGQTTTTTTPKQSSSGVSGSGLLKKGAILSGSVFTAIISVILVILWAFSVGATWRAFRQEGLTKPGYIATAIAILVPLSGFIITPVMYAVLKYFA